MPKLKLKGMKMVLSETAANNADECDVGVGGRRSNTCTSNSSVPFGSSRSAPIPDAAPHCSIPSSSVGSNHNEDDPNQNNSTRLENVTPVNEAVNLIAVDRNGQQKKRGRTTLKELWALPPEERILVKANHLGQPIGPEAQILAGFLGMLARTGQQIEIHYKTWYKVPKTLKDELLKFIELRFALEISREYVLKSLGKKWRDYKHDLKKRHFKREDGLQANKDKHPDATIRWQWEQLVDFWYTRKGEDSEKLGIASRKQQKYTHTSGSKSFARKENEMEVSSGRKVGRLEFFKATHSKKDGSHMSVETEQIVDKANEKLAEYETIDEDMQIVETEILTEVIGKERCGRVRGVGLGPTPKSYYGRTISRNSTTSSNQSNEFVERFHQMEQEMKQLKEERDQERAERDQERAQREEERARYNALLGFLQDQFPGVTIPGVNAAGSTSQSPNQFSGDQ